MRFLEALLLGLLLGACGVLASSDMQATSEAENMTFSTQAASLAGTSVAQRTRVAEEINVAETEVALINSVNAQLHSTLAAGSTSTVAVIPETAEVSVEMAGTNMANESQRFVLTGISKTVHPATGCGVNVQDRFSSTTSELYMTIQSYYVESGTMLRAEWYYEGELRVRQDWIVDMTTTERCLWFMLDTTDTIFVPGAWSVVVYTDGQSTPIGSPTMFYIVD